MARARPWTIYEALDLLTILLFVFWNYWLVWLADGRAVRSLHLSVRQPFSSLPVTGLDWSGRAEPGRAGPRSVGQAQLSPPFVTVLRPTTRNSIKRVENDSSLAALAGVEMTFRGRRENYCELLVGTGLTGSYWLSLIHVMPTPAFCVATMGTCHRFPFVYRAILKSIPQHENGNISDLREIFYKKFRCFV